MTNREIADRKIETEDLVTIARLRRSVEKMSEFKGAVYRVAAADGPEVRLTDELERAMGIRRQVKDGLLTPEAALAWLEDQEFVGARIRRWLADARQWVWPYAGGGCENKKMAEDGGILRLEVDKGPGV